MFLNLFRKKILDQIQQVFESQKGHVAHENILVFERGGRP